VAVADLVLDELRRPPQLRQMRHVAVPQTMRRQHRIQPSFAAGTCISGCTDAFVTKLDPTGSTLVYSTYLGGGDRDGGRGIAVDASGNAYVTGSTNSTDFPTTPGAFQASFGGGGTYTSFITKIATNATRSQEDAATDLGSWTTCGSEVGTFSGGTIVASNAAASTAMFSFTGTAVSWIGVKCNVCGIAVVSLDGAPTEVKRCSRLQVSQPVLATR